MAGSPQSELHSCIVCAICSEPIRLEISRTDEHGKAVHEECYVRKMISRVKEMTRLDDEKTSAGLVRVFVRSLKLRRARYFRRVGTITV